MIITQGDTMQQLRQFDLKASLPLSICRWVRALDLKDNKLLVGTYGSEIYECELSDALVNKNTVLKEGRPVLAGHYTPNCKWTNEVWALAVLRKTNLFVSASDDATLRLWDAETHKQLCIHAFYQGVSNVNL